MIHRQVMVTDRVHLKDDVTLLVYCIMGKRYIGTMGTMRLSFAI
jgi:hypothetical protein